MSADDALLLFLGREGGIDGWLRLAEGAVAERGIDPAVLPVAQEDGAAIGTIGAVVPGEDVSIHWLELPAGLAPAQAIAAARLMAIEVSAQPVSEMHIAVGPPTEGSELRCIALVPVLAMAEWLARLQVLGFDPDIMIAEPLLLQLPEEGFVRHESRGTSLYRGSTEAFAMEPDLAGVALAGAEVAEVDGPEFEAGLAGAIALLPVDLRQGAFAKRRRWTIEWNRIRRIAQLGIAILVVTMAIQIAAILRYTHAADALEAEVQQVAVKAIPGGGDDIADLDRRLAQLRGGGVGYSAIASAVFGAVRTTANAELSAIVVEPDGSLKATVQADTPATLSALAGRIESDGFEVDSGGERSGGGRQVAELTVRPK